MTPLRLGLIGLGAIGADVVKLAAGELEGRIAIPAALVLRPRPAPRSGPMVTNDPEAFFAHGFDVVLEGAGHAAVRAYGERVLAGGADLIATSVGAFTDDALYARCRAAAEASGRRLIIPSAGIGALDILSAAAVGGLDEVTMVVRKDPSAWYGTPAERLFDLAAMTEPTVIFEGSPREGAAIYTQNVNISAAVSLAGLGLDRTRLIIYADPTIDTHVIEVTAKGAFGSYSFREDAAVSESNRKTGKIVAMAVLKTVRQLVSPVVVGA
jgi:aspartate dehydrogenase